MGTCSNMLLSISHKSQLLTNRKMTIKHSCQGCLHFYLKSFLVSRLSDCSWPGSFFSSHDFLQQAGTIEFGRDIRSLHNACLNWPVLMFSEFLFPTVHPVADIDHFSCSPNTVKTFFCLFVLKNIVVVKHEQTLLSWDFSFWIKPCYSVDRQTLFTINWLWPANTTESMSPSDS